MLFATNDGVCAVTDRDMHVLCTDMMMSNPSAAAACVMRTRFVDTRLCAMSTPTITTMAMATAMPMPTT